MSTNELLGNENGGLVGLKHDAWLVVLSSCQMTFIVVVAVAVDSKPLNFFVRVVLGPCAVTHKEWIFNILTRKSQ